MKNPYSFLLSCFLLPFLAFSQSKGIDSAGFFTDERVIELKLATDLRKLMTSKKENDYQPATVSLICPDSITITEDIRICARGVFRRKNCYLPSTMFDFKNPQSPQLSCLGKLKMVSGCNITAYDEQLVLKEYLAYKMYNLITDKSFRVRLLKITYDDTRNKVKLYSQYAFLIEDVDDVARRNKCREYKTKIPTESTDRHQMTTVALFQFMIGNTDWAVPNRHNIKLICSRNDSLARPYAVPYDFDFSGLVDAHYAIPAPELGTQSVKERVYRGFPRSMPELELSLNVFLQQKDSIYSLVKNCPFLKNGNKEAMIKYLNEFYRTAEDKALVRSHFIENARTR